MQFLVQINKCMSHNTNKTLNGKNDGRQWNLINLNSKVLLTSLKQLTWQLTSQDGWPAIGKFQCKTIYKRTLCIILNNATSRHILNALHSSLTWHQKYDTFIFDTRSVNIPLPHNACKPILPLLLLLEWPKLLQYIIIRNSIKSEYK
jgi:hypothetical protein